MTTIIAKGGAVCEELQFPIYFWPNHWTNQVGIAPPKNNILKKLPNMTWTDYARDAYRKAGPLGIHIDEKAPKLATRNVREVGAAEVKTWK